MLATPSRTLREGMAAALAREFESAYEHLKQATVESPNDVRAWFWRALASPSPGEAISCLRRVLLFEPGHAQAQYALARLMVSQAASVAANGQQAQALALAREATELAPDSDAVWIGLAAVSQDPNDRLEALQRAMALNPQAPNVRMLMRDALLHCGVKAAGADPERAQKLFREAGKLDPNDARVWQALARVATRASDAVEALRELVRIAPERAAARAALRKALGIDADSLAAAGSRTAAAARWREANALDERDTIAWLGLASTTDNRDEARHALETVRRLDPADARVSPLWAQWQLGPEPPAPVPALDAGPTARTSPGVPPAQVSTPIPPIAVAPVTPPPAAAAPAVARTAFVAATPGVAPVPAAASPAAGTPGRAAAPPAAAIPVSSTGVAAGPAAAPPLPATTPRAPVVPLPAAQPGSAGRTVLVVDDSPTVRKILSLTLERAGYTVVSAPDGEAALVSLDGLVPDLIMLDISMPKLDGYEVCKRIKANARTAHVPVVMLSGKDAFFDKVKGRMAGATEYLTKPFETAAVLAVIGRQFQPGASAAHG